MGRIESGLRSRRNQIPRGRYEIPVVNRVAARVRVGSDGVDEVRVRQRHGDRLGPERLTVLVAHRHDELPIGEFVAASREHLDDAVGGVGAVQRRGGGSLDDLDVVDVLGVDVRQAMPIDRPVHDDQRARALGRRTWLRAARRRCRERRRRAQPDGRLSTGRAVGVDQPHARHLALERPQCGDRGCLPQLRSVDARRRDGQVLAFRRRRGAGDDDLLQLHDVELELEVERLRAGPQRDLPRLGLVADGARAQRDSLAFGLLRRDGESVDSRGGRGDGGANLGDRHRRPAQRFARLPGDLACNDGRLRHQLLERRSRQHEQRSSAHDYVERTRPHHHDAPFCSMWSTPGSPTARTGGPTEWIALLCTSCHKCARPPNRLR